MSMFAVGSYTHHRSPDIDARGAGITIVERSDSSGTVRILSQYTDIRNPTYLDWDSPSRTLYAVTEAAESRGGVAAFGVSRPETDGICSLSLLAMQEGTGRPGCHLYRLPESGLVLTTSYSDGRLTGYPVRQRLPGPAVLDFQYTGKGPVSGRQDSAHAHQVMKSPHGEVLYVCDLGSDRIWMHTLGRLELPPVPALTVPGGYGPRHLAFDPVSPAVYVLCELVPRILVAEIDPDTALMRIADELDTVAPERMSMAAPAAVKIHPSGHTVAVSNRFDDTIGVFRILRGSETVGGVHGALGVGLELADRFDCRGRTPRDICFTPDGRALLIANQDSHTVTCRNFDPLSGLPSFQSPGNPPVENWGPVLETGTPVCVVMLD